MPKKQTKPKSLDITTASTATPTARPIVIMNHPMMDSDPMVKAAASPKPSPETPDKPAAREGKTVQRAMEDTVVSEPTAADDRAVNSAIVTSGNDVIEQALASEASDPDRTDRSPVVVPKAGSSGFPFSGVADEVERHPERDMAAEQVAVEEKELADVLARQVELDDLITKGNYMVPISPAHASGSVVSGALIGLGIVVLLVAIIDLLLDIGIVTIAGIPHTRFF